MKIVRVSGDHYGMGRQHAAQSRACREQLVGIVSARLAHWSATHERLAGTYVDALRRHSAATASMLDGIADGFDIQRERLRAYVASGWVAERRGEGGAAFPGEGCTALAVAGGATRDGAPILGKNRDYYRDHRELQILCDASPARGYRWVAVGSAGSPGVFSSGMNERGLCIADTHVATRDLGPGAPRYAQMLELLEGCADVGDAIRMLAGRPSVGGGNLVLADAAGGLAVCELSHGHMTTGLDRECVVATNHFTSAAMRRRHIPLSSIHRASIARRSVVRAALRAGSPLDDEAVRSLLALHGSQERAVCRHSYPSRSGRYGTISSVLYFPRTREVHIADGWPCVAPFRELRAERDFWLDDARREAPSRASRPAL